MRNLTLEVCSPLIIIRVLLNDESLQAKMTQSNSDRSLGDVARLCLILFEQVRKLGDLITLS